MSKFSQLHILKIEVAHGSDRHEINIYSNSKPTVNELLDELEKKTRVPKSNIQLIFKGQKLHYSPKGTLEQFGVFSGSRLLMVGEKLNPTNDALFRRILGVGKDVALIQSTLEQLDNEFTQMENGGIERTMINEYIPQMHAKACGVIKDLETFLKVIKEVQVDEQELPDVAREQRKTIQTITENINKCDSLLKRIAKVVTKDK